jgi:hypothetical protein
MDWVLVIFTFAKCYIDDNIIFSLILKDHMHHFHKVFNWFLKHNLKLHPNKCQFFQM